MLRRVGSGTAPSQSQQADTLGFKGLIHYQKKGKGPLLFSFSVVQKVSRFHVSVNDVELVHSSKSNQQVSHVVSSFSHIHFNKIILDQHD